MVKRITTLLIVAVMVFSVMGITTAKADAATAPAYVMIRDAGWDANKIKEKVGNYYIWIDTNYNTGKYTLKCSQLIGTTPKVLKSVYEKNKQHILGSIVTNGNVIYYAVGTYGKYVDSYDSITIYKTNVKGTTNVAIKTLKNLHSLVGCYNGKLYYTGLIEGFYEGSLYSMDLSTKKTKLVKKGMGALASNANNIVMWGEKNLIRYNVANKKTVVLPFDTDDAAIIGNKIFFADDAIRPDEEDGGPVDVGTAIYRTDLNGKNKKMVAEVLYDSMAHFGHKNAYFVKESGRINRYNFNNDAMYRYVAFLGKTTLNSVKSDGKNSVKVSWKKVANAGKYQVYRATAKNGTYKLVKTTTATSWKNTGLTTGKTYYYKVRAMNGDTRGAFSAVKSAKASNK